MTTELAWALCLWQITLTFVGVVFRKANEEHGVGERSLILIRHGNYDFQTGKLTPLGKYVKHFHLVYALSVLQVSEVGLFVVLESVPLRIVATVDHYPLKCNEVVSVTGEPGILMRFRETMAMLGTSTRLLLILSSSIGQPLQVDSRG